MADSLAVATAEAESAIASEDFAGAMRALSYLRAPVDAFFDKVTVNADDPALRLNRLRLLSALRDASIALPIFPRSRDKISRRHCEARSAEATQPLLLDCFASLAKTHVYPRQITVYILRRSNTSRIYMAASPNSGR